MDRTPSAATLWWSLVFDLWSAKVLVWAARVGRDAELTPQAELFFFDRYRVLANYHSARGHVDKANRFRAKAERFRHDQDSGPPYAAAMAMPRPRRFVHTDAVARRWPHPPDDAA